MKFLWDFASERYGIEGGGWRVLSGPARVVPAPPSAQGVRAVDGVGRDYVPMDSFPPELPDEISVRNESHCQSISITVDAAIK